jgi:hypothetical protein
MSDFQQWVHGDTAPELPVNENFEALAGASLYAWDQDGTSGLAWGYMGGVFKDTTKAKGTTTLADGATNYIVAALADGTISDATTTTNWDDDTTYARVAKVTTSGGQITAVVDYRFDEFGLFAMLGGGGGGGGSVAGSDTQVQYNNGGSFGADSTLTFDDTNKILGARRVHFGSVNGDSNGISGDDPHLFNVSNDPNAVAGPSGFGFQLLRVNSYGVNGWGGNVHFCRYRGTVGSPTAVQNGDTFMSFGIRGWDSGAALSQSAASWAAVATENWTASAHGIKFVWQITANGSTTRANGMELASTGLAVTGDVTATGAIKNGEPIIICASDETTALTTGTAKVTFRMPYAFTLTGIRASLSTAQTSGSIFTVDVNESGSTILSTKITIDNTEKTSTTAATAPVLSDTSLADDAEITIDIDQVGDGTAKGLKVTLLGRKT